jgi:serine-type D-Ala-D-Ala carboxypeptidase/endopeptidase (penicillin-binding protein 4)
MHRVLILTLGLLGTRIAASAGLPSLAEEARLILGPEQGVYVEGTDGTVLLAQAANTPVHPASVSKVPTTLALLRTLGPDFRFVTTFASSGPVINGTLQGDLLVEADGNPAFVDEDALLVADRLNALGITRVAGTLRLHSPLTFDWQDDGDGRRLIKALSGHISASALMSVRALELEHVTGPAVTSLKPQGIQFTGAAASVNMDAAKPRVAESSHERLLITHRSQPLLSLAKSLNDYSNNIFTPLAERAGGAASVESLARSVVPAAMRNEITLGDGAGLDPRNRLSPRAAVTLLRALEHELNKSGHQLFDILPVAGIDEGTLHKRLNAPEEVGRVLGKTGTVGDYGASALIGAISTNDRGTVYFAILNHGVPVPEARRRQDQFVRVLLTHLHSVPWNYQLDSRPAIARAEVLTNAR